MPVPSFRPMVSIPRVRRASALRQRRRFLELEGLEDRTLLSASAMHPGYVIFHPAGSGPADSPTPYPSAFAPAGMRQAYGVNLVSGDGTGETIAIVDAYDDPNFVDRSPTLPLASDTAFLNSDLHQFDVQYGLPEPNGFFTKVNQSGGTAYPPTDPAGAGNPFGNWELEEALDVEWVHAMAPGAHIIFVEADDASDNLFIAANWAGTQSGAQVVTMSWGGGEFSGETSYDSMYFTQPSGYGVTYLASTGDGGVPGGYPAFSPDVVAVGGTSLYVNSNGSYNSEVGWDGSGGGISTEESLPTYQSGLNYGARTIPDVSFDADPNTGASVYDEYNGASTGGPWWQVGGTSLASPSYAALIGITDQLRAARGLGSLNGPAQTLPALYSLQSGDFHDITSGDNGYAAGTGYDLVTGIGTPVANKQLVNLSTLHVNASTPANGATVSTPPTTYSITFSDPIVPSSLHASSFMVHGVPATGVSLDSTHTIATFAFAGGNPVTAQGPQTMTLAAGAATIMGGTATSAAYNATFYYDVITLAVASTTPAPATAFTLPAITFTYDVTFNEPIDPSTVNTSNLTLSQGTVTAATTMSGNQTVVYTLTGLNTEGTVTIGFPSGIFKDQYDNPASTPFTGTYFVDDGTVALTPLNSVAPFGSLIYDRPVPSALLYGGDVDQYTVAADPGQTLTVLVTPSTSSTLMPTIQLSDPSSTVLGSASASGPGKNALLQTVATTTSGTYNITIGGLNNSFGNYTFLVYLDTALDTATQGTAANGSRATAQNLNFVTLQTSLSSASRAAVVGSVGQPFTVNASFTGWWDNTGSHNATNPNYFVGQESSTQYRDFFVFNLSGMSQPIASAAFQAMDDLGGYSSPLSSDVYSLFDVSTPIQALEATGAGQPGIFNDLGTGTSYGSTTIIAADDGTVISTPFNSTGVLILNTALGGQFALGGALTSIHGSDTQYLFGGSGSPTDVTQLVLTPADSHYYALTLAAGESAAVGLKNLSGGGAGTAIQDGSGNTLATGKSGAADLDQSIGNFVAPAAGTYYVVVAGTGSSSNYSLIITRDAAFDQKNNSGFGSAQNLTGNVGVLGALTASATDWYQVTLSGTQNGLKVETATPLGGPSQLINKMNPSIQLYNASDTLIGSGTVLGDGRNQSLVATGLAPGATYYVKITPANAIQGEYYLGVTPLQAPAVITNPASQTVLAGTPVTFNTAVSGSPAPAIQWQVSTNSGGSYSPINGATGATYTIASPTTGMSGNLYEAVCSNAASSVTTTPALLTVQTLPAFTSGTPTASVTAGQTYSFTFTASGFPSPTLSATNLPSWLSFTPATGVLTGSSTLAQTDGNIQIKAMNAAGTATTTFSIAVNPAGVTHLLLSAPGGVTVATPFNFTVTAQDQYNNTATSYGGTVTFAGGGTGASLPPPTALTNGVDSFSATLDAGGSQIITSSASGLPTASATITVNGGPLEQYLVTTLIGGSTATAGNSFLVQVQAADQFGNPITSGYSGPTTVTASISPTSTASSFPATVSIGSNGLGLFLANLQTVGTYAISVASGSFMGSAAPVTVTPAAPAKLAFTAQPQNTPTGTALPAVTVQIQDQYGNLVTTDNSDQVTVGIANGPSGFLSGSTTTVTAVGGVATFNQLTLVVPGSYQLSAAVVGSFTGPNSSNFSVIPLQVLPSTFKSSPSGFSLQFNTAFLVNSTTPVLYGQGFGATAPAPSVIVTTDPGNLNDTAAMVTGSLVLNTATNSVTFLATNASLLVNSGSPLLPDGTYTVIIRSSAATDGFQALNSGGGFLDGLANGTPGSGNYTTSFVVNAAASNLDALWIPATADGPGQPLNAPGGNKANAGYPLYLTDGNGVTNVQVTLQYNPSLLTVTGVSGAHFALSGASTPGNAILIYNGPALASKASTPVTVGFIRATVPSGTAANPTPYKAKDILHLTSATINHHSTGLTTDDALHLVAFVADADGNGSYSNNDGVLITRTLLNADSGFAAYPLVDPLIVADTDGAGFIPADAALQANDAGAGLAAPNLSNPPIPTGVVFVPIANNVDPRLSLGVRGQGSGVSNNGTVTIAVNIDDPHPQGSTGLIEAHLALTYDPSVLTVSAADVQLGSVLASAGGWSIDTKLNPATGQIAISLSSTTPISSTTGGSLVIIDFHRAVGVNEGSSAGSLTPDPSPLTPVMLVASVNPTGQQVVMTDLEDAQGTFTLTPAPSNGFDPRIDGVVMSAGDPASLVSSAIVSAPVVPPQGPSDAGGADSRAVESLVAETVNSNPPLVVPEATDQEIMVAPSAPSEAATVHASLTTVQIAAAVVAGSSSPASTSSGLLAPAPLSGFVFQFSSTAAVSPQGSTGLPGWQHVADQFFQALKHFPALSIDPTLVDSVKDAWERVVAGQLTRTQPVLDGLDGINWDEVGNLDGQGTAEPGPRETYPGRREVTTHPTSAPRTVSQSRVDRDALDQYFAQTEEDSTQAAEDETEAGCS